VLVVFYSVFLSYLYRHGGGKGGDGTYVSSLYQSYVKATHTHPPRNIQQNDTLQRPPISVFCFVFPLTVVAPPLSVVECGVWGGSFVWLFVCGGVLVVLLCV